MKKIQSLLVATAASLLFANVANANCCCDANADAKKSNWYVGIEGGASYPIKDSFKKKIDVPGVGKLESKGKLSDSGMYGALVGYKFYPDMAVEFSWQKKPKYKLKISLPETKFDVPIPTLGVTGQGVVNATSADVHVSSELYLLGLVYNLEKIKEFTPYVGVEFGVADIKVKRTRFLADFNVKAPDGTVVASYPNAETMVIKKSSSISPAFQLSVGVTTPEILPNLKGYAAGRMQIIHNATLKYDLVSDNKVTKTAKLKQSIAVGEIVLGLTYDLPF